MPSCTFSAHTFSSRTCFCWSFDRRSLWTQLGDHRLGLSYWARLWFKVLKILGTPGSPSPTKTPQNQTRKPTKSHNPSACSSKIGYSVYLSKNYRTLPNNTQKLGFLLHWFDYWYWRQESMFGWIHTPPKCIDTLTQMIEFLMNWGSIRKRWLHNISLMKESVN